MSITHIAICITLLIWAGPMQAQQSFQSVFLPDKEYHITVETTVSGNDGHQDIIPSSSTQRILLTTGSAVAGEIPVRLTVFSASNTSGSAGSETLNWEFTFRASEDGTIRDISVQSGSEEVNSDLASSMLGRQLHGVILMPAYKFATPPNAPTVNIEKSESRIGSENLVDVTWTMELPELQESPVVTSPMSRIAGGSGVYDTELRFFTEFEQYQTNRIYVVEDSHAAEREILMRRETRVRTMISDASGR